MRIAIFVLLALTPCWAQAPNSCKPSSLNIPSAPYPCINPDRSVAFRVEAPNAQKVQVRLGGTHDMTRGADGLWTVTIPPQVVGFHYYAIIVDGSVVADPATRTFSAPAGTTAELRFRLQTRIFTLQKTSPRRGASELVLLEGHRKMAPRQRLHSAEL